MKENYNNNRQGLYRSEFEHDSCGIGFVANLKNKKSHDIVEDAIQMLLNMEHRGACGCDEKSGDGAGILIQMPHKFFKKETQKLGFELPPFGSYGVGMVFLPSDDQAREECKSILNKNIEKLGLELLGYRPLPVDNSDLGEFSSAVEPVMEQVFIKKPDSITDPDDFERKLFVLRNYTRNVVESEVKNLNDQFHIASLSYKTISYKGQLTTFQLRPYFPDLHDNDVETALALIHSRFSTNTFPEWRLAQPFRFIAHNGEINTVKGNVNWMKTKEALFEEGKFTKEELDMIMPICDLSQSDSANLDNAIELLTLGGRELPHVMMMLIPEAWQENDMMDPVKKAFYEYHACLMEPWDGPASICFTDGKFVGATLDRNGLRPSRYLVTEDDKVIMASETGVLNIDESRVVSKGRLKPGRMFIANLEEGRIISDEELKSQICSQAPYEEWIQKYKLNLKDIPEPEEKSELKLDEDTLLNRQQAFGFTSEDLKVLLGPMATDGKEPVGSMGADTPVAILSEQSQHLSFYFKQLFAQVTNPPIDPIRERLVMSIMTSVGEFRDILNEKPEHCRVIQLDDPILTNSQLDKIKNLNNLDGFKTAVVDCIFKATEEPGTLEKALEDLFADVEQKINEGNNILILSNKNIDSDHAAIPSLLYTSAVHHHLIRRGLRGKATLLVEAGDVIETHHFATLIGYGASAVNPYLAFETILGLKREGIIQNEELTDEKLIKNYIKSIGGGLLKILSKMGISTVQSYHGAMIFEALGLNKDVVDKYFTGTVSRIEGIGLDGIAWEAVTKHRVAFPLSPFPNPQLEVGGVYQWKRRGEFHLFNPETTHLIQYATRTNNYQVYKKYSRLVNKQDENVLTLRNLLKFKERTPVPLHEVEPIENIFKRFATGAMSFGSISHEAHATLAIAMNRIGGKSNSGEGGEDEMRFFPKENGDWERSAIKQVASGRFGVTSYYMTNSDELQIKMAQGAKPGEGGQLPGHKVDKWIAKVRHSTPGVGLISPPPHHDIYSIEDLAQLIFDLKNANRDARVNVKLVSEAGVGTVAAGVCKAHADVVLISGHDGGTGASPLSSIRHAGLPWELGVAETHQTLVRNKLRDRIVVQTDGQIRTGRDIAIATLLGAEEWGVATAALVVEGCIMMRKCHVNTCPVGIATQDERLRGRYDGDPEYVVNLFTFLASELREIMAELGFRTVDEMVGRVDVLDLQTLRNHHWKYEGIDLSPVLYKEPLSDEVGLYKQQEQDHGLDEVIDWQLLDEARPALENGKNVYAEFPIRNIDRATGTILSNEISKIYRGDGLPEDTIHFKFKGSAGQSFGAFTAPGLTLELEGEANDYFGKGLSGSKVILYPHKEAQLVPHKNIIVGNVAFYGATLGEAYINGVSGERFLVRNSGVKAVVEGVGDHGCEYMTGGVAVILGETGRNFAAGMSGGVAYVYDPENQFIDNVNQEMVDLDPLDDEDLDVLKRMITSHFNYTNSSMASQILENWDNTIKEFVKVMPRDYKEVLKQMREEEKTASSKKSKKQAVVHG